MLPPTLTIWCCMLYQRKRVFGHFCSWHVTGRKEDGVHRKAAADVLIEDDDTTSHVDYSCQHGQECLECCMLSMTSSHAVRPVVSDTSMHIDLAHDLMTMLYVCSCMIACDHATLAGTAITTSKAAAARLDESVCNAAFRFCGCTILEGAAGGQACTHCYSWQTTHVAQTAHATLSGKPQCSEQDVT